MTESLCILIVDDQRRARTSLRALLSTWPRAGEIREASNGREAISLAEELQPALLVMDVRMPEMDGLEATRQIKARWPQIKVVLLSIYAEHRDEALGAGAEAFVAKGEASETLLDLLSAIMGGV